MRYRRIAAAIVAYGHVALAVPLLADHEMPDRKQIRAAANEVDEAREKLRDLTRRLDDSQKELARIELSRKLLQQKLQAVRDGLEKKHADYSRLIAARREQLAAQTVLDDASQPVLKNLRNDKKYQEAVWEAKMARNRLADVSLEKTLDPVEQRKLLDKLRRATLLPGQLELDAIAADPEADSARDALNRSSVKMSVVSRRMEQDFEKDPDYRKAQKESEQAESALAHAKEQVAQKQAQIVQAKRQLSREESQLVQVRLRHQIDTERERRRRNAAKKEK